MTVTEVLINTMLWVCEHSPNFAKLRQNLHEGACMLLVQPGTCFVFLFLSKLTLIGRRFGRGTPTCCFCANRRLSAKTTAAFCGLQCFITVVAELFTQLINFHDIFCEDYACMQISKKNSGG